MWAGSHHLHYTALPQWVQTLGMAFSVMLLVPSWAAAANALLTLNGAWHRVRDDATLRFMMVAALFYGLTTFEGSFLAIRAVNSLSHYTDWTVGHVHAGALGWVAMITFGSIYAAVPWLWKRESMYSPRLVEVAFLARRGGDHHLRAGDVELGHHPGTDVADLCQRRDAGLFLPRLPRGHAPVLHRPRGRRDAVPDRRAGRLLQHMDDGARATPAGGRTRGRLSGTRVPVRPVPQAAEYAGCSRLSSPFTTGWNARRSGSWSRSCWCPASAESSKSRRCSRSTRPSRRRLTCGSTRRSSWPAATSTSGKAAMPVTPR